MKKLYILTSNNGDGSSSIHATFDQSLILDMKEMYNNDLLNMERWADGDGFHYETWNLPDECTPESMGFYPLKRANL